MRASSLHFKHPRVQLESAVNISQSYNAQPTPQTSLASDWLTAGTWLMALGFEQNRTEQNRTGVQPYTCSTAFIACGAIGCESFEKEEITDGAQNWSRVAANIRSCCTASILLPFRCPHQGWEGSQRGWRLGSSKTRLWAAQAQRDATCGTARAPQLRYINGRGMGAQIRSAQRQCRHHSKPAWSMLNVGLVWGARVHTGRGGVGIGSRMIQIQGRAIPHVVMVMVHPNRLHAGIRAQELWVQL